MKTSRGVFISKAVTVLNVSCILLVFCDAACRNGIGGGPEELHPLAITDEAASRFAVYSMMSAYAYHENDRVAFPSHMLGWQQVDRDGHPTTLPTVDHPVTNLAYDIWQNGNSVIVVYRGTDSKIDYLVSNFALPVSPAYKQASKEFRKLKLDLAAQNRTIVAVAGHSLGGGIALSMSLKYGVDAYVFDPSPRVFDGLGDHHEDAIRICVFQDGEVLERIRRKYPKAVVKPENTYRCTYSFGQFNHHRGDILAQCLLESGAKVNADLAALKAQLHLIPIDADLDAED